MKRDRNNTSTLSSATAGHSDSGLPSKRVKMTTKSDEAPSIQTATDLKYSSLGNAAAFESNKSSRNNQYFRKTIMNDRAV